VATAPEHAKRGDGIHIGDHLTAVQRRALEEVAIASGSPRGTAILAGRCVSLADLVEEIEQTEQP
jgi:hypothetical protein